VGLRAASGGTLRFGAQSANKTLSNRGTIPGEGMGIFVAGGKNGALRNKLRN